MTVLHTCSTLRAEHIPNNDERTEDERTAAILTQQHSSFTKKNAIFADMTNKNVNLKTYKEACNAIYPDCPIRNILARVSDKWSMLVLHALSQKSPMRFTELRNAIGDATPKMLSASLKTLEEDGIVCRTAYPEIPPRVEYTLTGRGLDMLEAMQPLTEWAIKNMEDILRDRAAKQQRASAKS